MPLLLTVFVLLTAEGDDDIHLDRITPELAAAAAAAIGVWLLLLAVFALIKRPRHIDAGPPTMDLATEPPALAAYIAAHCRAVPSAVPATLMDLAARRFIEIEEYGEVETIIRVRRPASSELLPYERRVLDQVTSLAHDDVVPLQALTLGTTGRAKSWRKDFEQEVAKDAAIRGLAEDLWSIQTWTIVRAAGFVAGALVVAVSLQANGPELGIGIVLAAAAGAHTLLRRIFGVQRLTEAGYTTGARWLGVSAYLAESDAFTTLPPGAVMLWDRYMSYATAFGLARRVLSQMPMTAADDHHAWSAYGGTWHEVDVSYPRTRLVWGRTPLGGMLVGLLIGAAGAGVVWLTQQVLDIMSGTQGEAAAYVRLGAWVIAGIGAAVVLWGLHTLYLSLSDLGPRMDVEGELVRQRSFTRNEKENYYCIAVDDGKQPRLKAWLVTPAMYQALNEGSIVRASVSRRLRHVYSVEVVRPSRQVQPAPVSGTATAAFDPAELLRQLVEQAQRSGQRQG